jgi:2-polyprenyl-6-methoxyphenol hydroxylase-like FAD-dependent oxidoreductase
MSPVGGVGINYAIQDAVEAANVLTAPLLAGKVSDRDLAEVQKRREFPTRVIQWMQALMQQRLVASVLQSQQSVNIPWQLKLFFRIPVLRDIPARMIGFGIKRARLAHT